MTGTTPGGVRQEEASKPVAQFTRHFLQVHQPAGARRALDLQLITVVVMITFQRLDEQIVRREPNRPAPVRVAAEEECVRLARHIIDTMHFAVRAEFVRMFRVKLRQRPDAEGRQEFVFVEQITQHPLQALARRNGEQAVPLAGFAIGNVSGQIGPMLEKPVHPLVETGQASALFLIEHFDGDQRQQADE